MLKSGIIDTSKKIGGGALLTEEKRRKLLSLFWEFFRYAVVGGIAFLADYGTLFLFQELIQIGRASCRERV